MPLTEQLRTLGAGGRTFIFENLLWNVSGEELKSLHTFRFWFHATVKFTRWWNDIGQTETSCKLKRAPQCFVKCGHGNTLPEKIKNDLKEFDPLLTLQKPRTSGSLLLLFFYCSSFCSHHHFNLWKSQCGDNVSRLKLIYEAFTASGRLVPQVQ